MKTLIKILNDFILVIAKTNIYERDKAYYHMADSLQENREPF